MEPTTQNQNPIQQDYNPAAQTPPMTQQMPPAPQEQSIAPDAPKKSSLITIITVILILFLIVLAAGAYYYYMMMPSYTPEVMDVATQEQAAPAPTEEDELNAEIDALVNFDSEADMQSIDAEFETAQQ